MMDGGNLCVVLLIGVLATFPFFFVRLSSYPDPIGPDPRLLRCQNINIENTVYKRHILSASLLTLASAIFFTQNLNMN